MYGYRIMAMQNGMFKSTRFLEVPTNMPIGVRGDDDGFDVSGCKWLIHFHVTNVRGKTMCV